MQWLSNISVRRPVYATVLILVLVVIGLARRMVANGVVDRLRYYRS
jgi:hypothetical protein